VFKFGIVVDPYPGFTQGYGSYEPTLDEIISFTDYVEFIMQDNVKKLGIGVLTMPDDFKRDNREQFEKYTSHMAMKHWTQTVDRVTSKYNKDNNDNNCLIRGSNDLHSITIRKFWNIQYSC